MQQLGLGKSAGGQRLEAELGDNRTQHRSRIFGVEDPEVPRHPQPIGVLAQDPVADVVKRPGRASSHVDGEQPLDAVHHLPGGPVGERAQQDPIGRTSLLDHPSHAVGQRSRLARSRPGDDQDLARLRLDHGPLLRVEVALEIKPRRPRAWVFRTYFTDSPRSSPGSSAPYRRGRLRCGACAAHRGTTAARSPCGP